MMKSCLGSRVVATWLLALLVSPAIGAEGTKLDPSAPRANPGRRPCGMTSSISGLRGKGWEETKSSFDRLPSKAEGVVRKPVWGLSRDSTGLCVRFVTDAPDDRGPLDLEQGVARDAAHAGDGSQRPGPLCQGRRWPVALAGGRSAQGVAHQFGTAGVRPSQRPRASSCCICRCTTVSSRWSWVSPRRTRSPGRNRVRSAAQADRVLRDVDHPRGMRPRPGMVHTAILGRQLNRPIINLGFSGNGKMEPELADLLAELDPAVYVLDCLPNMSCQGSRGAGRTVRENARKRASGHPDRPGRGSELYSRLYPGFSSRAQRT